MSDNKVVSLVDKKEEDDIESLVVRVIHTDGETVDIPCQYFSFNEYTDNILSFMPVGMYEKETIVWTPTVKRIEILPIQKKQARI